MNPDERMPEGKRGWTVVREDEDEEQVPSSESSRPEDRPRMYYVSKDRLREAAGMDSLHQRARVKASPEEVLAALPTMSRKEKKEIQKALVKEESQHAFERLERSRLLAHYDSSSSGDERDPVRPKDRLRWSANGDGHYEWPSWTVDADQLSPEKSGQEFQAQLKRMGLSWHEPEESFQFGSGEPETSHRGYIYPVGIHGSGELIRMSCVGGARNCPGLVGPSEMARWNVIMSFADKKIQIKGTWKPMSLTATRHPAVCLLDFGEDVTQFWSRPEIQDALKMLVRSPQTWAFKADKLPSDEGSSEEEEEDQEGSDGSSDEAYESFDEEAIDRHRLETALERLEKDLTFIPVQEAQKQSDDEDWEIVQGSDDEEASVTSHEFGVQHQEEESTDDESETEAQDEKEVHGPVKHMSKAQRSEWRHNTRGIQDTYVQRRNEAKEKIT
ncbi:unnamed protein product, partial [Durusdinium trenchii]